MELRNEKVAEAAVLAWTGQNYGDYLEYEHPQGVITPEEWDAGENVFQEHVLEAVAVFVKFNRHLIPERS